MRGTALVVLASAVLSAQAASIRPEGLRREYRANPLGPGARGFWKARVRDQAGAAMFALDSGAYRFAAE